MKYQQSNNKKYKFYSNFKKNLNLTPLVKNMICPTFQKMNYQNVLYNMKINLKNKSSFPPLAHVVRTKIPMITLPNHPNLINPSQ